MDRIAHFQGLAELQHGHTDAVEEVDHLTHTYSFCHGLPSLSMMGGCFA
jgi:hypothetical protein